ncbi:MAG: hypothetical protein J0J10_00955 [Bosea sp.]|uniref:hypothetical protein n=1 Tax=Bosea sp. (in: a-proteobacteria) TaxID=1871050 RepID=UPI001ACED4EE|nr:hypothetical protein [Bosea sp. (in: a-proteobacteria)]MBN9467315.1 hypothetical protein [Bosea sp. (in: a-proteobacteria)]
MRFIDNAKEALIKGYVAWLVYIGTAAQLIFEFGLNQSLPSWTVVLLLVLILIGRTVKQESVSGPAAPEVEFTGEHAG